MGPQNEQVEPDRMTFFPWRVLKSARQAVPAVNYALGIAGIAAAGAIITTFLGWTKAGIVLFALIFTGMVLLFVFSEMIVAKRRSTQIAGEVLVWAVSVFFVTFLAFTVTAFADEWPRAWVVFLEITPPHPASSKIDELSRRIDFSGLASNLDAVATLRDLGVLASEQAEKNKIVMILKRKLEGPFSHDRDRWIRKIRKSILEAIVRIRNFDIHRTFLQDGLVGSDLVAVDLRNVDLAGLSLRGSFLIGTDFRGANLRKVDLSFTFLRNVLFQDADMTDTLLHGADWFNARGLDAKQMRSINIKGIRRCPQDKNGKHSKKAFVKFADDHYFVGFSNWTDDEQIETEKAWANYAETDGLCDLVARLKRHSEASGELQ